MKTNIGVIEMTHLKMLTFLLFEDIKILSFFLRNKIITWYRICYIYFVGIFMCGTSLGSSDRTYLRDTMDGRLTTARRRR